MAIGMGIPLMIIGTSAGKLLPKAGPWMNTIKTTQYLKDAYPEVESTVFYTDLRAFGKGFEELLMRSKGNGVTYIRGLPGDVGVVGIIDHRICRVTLQAGCCQILGTGVECLLLRIRRDPCHFPRSNCRHQKCKSEFY